MNGGKAWGKEGAIGLCVHVNCICDIECEMWGRGKKDNPPCILRNNLILLTDTGQLFYLDDIKDQNKV
ncbi:hypothetical protein BX070DRAFT_138290 [Coemansia spiralis]|nr:hypothetical protein BX070DRAFT_138290 [Coemansia spiralis]